MSGELVTYPAPTMIAGDTNERRRWVALMKPAADLAGAIAGTSFVRADIRNNPGAIAACVLYGDEVGLGPMQALAQIAVIEGRPALSAEAMRALILSRGHELWIEESTISKATIAGKRRDSQQISRVTWTMDDARRANLADRQTWRKYPRQMLAARATAELARLIFADAIGGLAVAEELDEETGAAPAGTRATKTSRRKREQTTLEQTTRRRLEPADEPEDDAPPLPGEPGYDPETEPEPRTFTRMHIRFRETGIEDRQERIAFAAEHVGRDLQSTKDLSAAEVSSVISALDERAQMLARLRASVDDEGSGGAAARSLDEPEQGARPLAPAPAPPDDEPEPAGEQTYPHTSRMLIERLQAERLPTRLIGELGSELYPGRSLEQLSDDERGVLLAAILERANETAR